MAAAGSATPRAQPFYCPYCGEQDIRPGERGDTFHCRLCDRRFELSYLGLGDLSKADAT